MDEIMTAQFGSDYNRTEVLGFSAGSVVVDFQTIFNQAPVASDNFLEATTTAMENAIVAAISGGSLGNLTVVAGSFGVATGEFGLICLSISRFIKRFCILKIKFRKMVCGIKYTNN